MKPKLSLPTEKLPLQHQYDNWVFLENYPDNGVLRVRFNTRSGWMAAGISSLACLIFGTVMFWWTKHWLCFGIMIPTALGLVAMNWYKTHQEAAAGDLFRIHLDSGKIELPRHRETLALTAVTLKLQIYSLSDDVGCELNLEENKTGRRFPLTRTLGKDRRIQKLCEALAEQGLSFQEEDLTAFQRP